MPHVAEVCNELISAVRAARVSSPARMCLWLLSVPGRAHLWGQHHAGRPGSSLRQRFPTERCLGVSAATNRIVANVPVGAYCVMARATPVDPPTSGWNGARACCSRPAGCRSAPRLAPGPPLGGCVLRAGEVVYAISPRDTNQQLKAKCRCPGSGTNRIHTGREYPTRVTAHESRPP